MYDTRPVALPDALPTLEKNIRACTLCTDRMKTVPRPVFSVSSTAQILIAGQAPGNLAMQSGKAFTDPSGLRLRAWMGIDETVFYDARHIAIVPMGFCFPGYDSACSDLPPLKQCAETWRAAVLDQMPNIKLTLLVGSYAQAWHLGKSRGKTLTETVKAWRVYAKEGFFVLPHPSWRNNHWLRSNPWFENDTLPALQHAVSACLSS